LYAVEIPYAYGRTSKVQYVFQTSTGGNQF